MDELAINYGDRYAVCPEFRKFFEGSLVLLDVEFLKAEVLILKPTFQLLTVRAL